MKVENVVKEPKNPTPKKSCNDLEGKISSLIKNPINKHPAILINKVLAANPKIERLFRIFDKKNLDPAPRPPPTKIKT